MLARMRLSFWICALGAISLYVFFVALASIPPGQVAGVTALIAALAALLWIRGVRLASELADRGGDPRIRRALNRQRERRGF